MQMPSDGGGRFSVVYDPRGQAEDGLPLDRETHEKLASVVLFWPQGQEVPPADCLQLALQLAGAAHAAAADLHRAVIDRPQDDTLRVAVGQLLTETGSLLAGPPEGTKRCVQERARLLLALYDHLTAVTAAADAQPSRETRTHRRGVGFGVPGVADLP